MCSIFGFDKITSLKHWPQIFCKDMRHRGPDHESWIEIDDFILGHQRLAITDPVATSNQPFITDSSILTFNGEIYNFLELRDTFLNDCEFKTNSDTEVLVRLLETRGLSILNKLNGMFAFCWYQKRERRTILCRDRFGVKPIYWTRSKGGFQFASEIRPLSRIIQKIDFDEQIVDLFINETKSDTAKETFIKGIFQILPGHYLIRDSTGEIREKKWYNGDDYSISSSSKSEKQLIDEFESILISSIELRARSDVPVSMTLSGGIDSSTIYTLLKEHSNAQVTPFLFSHEDSKTDEADQAKILTNKYKDDLKIITSSRRSFQNFKDMLRVLEFPIWAPTAFAYLNTYKEVRQQGFRIVIEGHGADELLGGYPYMIDVAINQSIQEGHFTKGWELLKVFNQIQNPFLNQLRRPHFLLLPWYILKFFKFKYFRRELADFQKTLNEAFDDKILPIVLRAFDRTSMANSVESRCPFMDFRVVEFGKRLPMSMKVNSMGSKAILRKILLKYGNSFVYEAQPKMGFSDDLPQLLNQPENKEQLRKAILSFNLPRHSDLKASALRTIESEYLTWGTFQNVWKVASLELIRQIYEEQSVNAD